MKSPLLLLLTVFLSASYAQENMNTGVSSNERQITLIFNQQDFGEKFSVLYSSEGDYDYYAIDLTKLEGEFARIYFMNLSYSDHRIVNLDADLEKDLTWFKSYYKFGQEDIKCLFDDLKEKTEKEVAAMSEEEKSAWINKFNKFKSIGKNE